MANEPWVIAPCGGVRLSKDSFEITYDENSNKPLVEVAGRHKFTYIVKFEKQGNKIVANHTYGEILDAYQSGEKVGGEYDNLVYSLSQITNGCVFTTVDYYNLDKHTVLRMLYIASGNIATEGEFDLTDTYPENYLVEILKEGNADYILDNKGNKYPLVGGEYLYSVSKNYNGVYEFKNQSYDTVQTMDFTELEYPTKYIDMGFVETHAYADTDNYYDVIQALKNKGTIVIADPFYSGNNSVFKNMWYTTGVFKPTSVGAYDARGTVTFMGLQNTSGNSPYLACVECNVTLTTRGMTVESHGVAYQLNGKAVVSTHDN